MSDKNSALTASQQARIERNRQKALLLKQSKLLKRPLEKEICSIETVKVPKVRDTGGGFLLEENSDDEEQRRNVVHEKGAVLESCGLHCLECEKEFTESFLFENFDYEVCDQCRDNEEKHKLITKSDAKSTYLLKDMDLDKREPLLKFISKKNPHHQTWGDMKLYLEIQVSERALEVWGSEEAIEQERENRLEKLDIAKRKKFDKKVKELRKQVRSSLWRKDTSAHEHEFGAESYNEDEDIYSKTCTSCGHVMTYEKM